MVKKVVILLILATIIGCSGEKKQNTTTQKENIKIVKSIKLEEKTIANIKNYNGELKPQQEMKIVTTTGGDIEEIYFKNGDRVKKGEVIAKISNADVEASFFEAQGQLLKAKSTYSTEKISFEKYKKLYEKEIISENDYLTIKNRYETAQGDLKIAEGKFLKAKDDYDRLRVITKIDGVITDLFVKKYERVESGKEIVTIVDSSKMEVDIAVSGNDIKYSKLGNKAKIYIEELGISRDGVTSEINLSSDSNSKKYSLRLLVDNGDNKILKGMYAKVNLEQGEVSGIFVPTKAVIIKDLYSYIAIVRDEKATIYRVTPKETIGDMQLIEFEDYKAGDRVVVEGQYLLNNNDKVKEN
ncbi:MAG: efflux RND transporter periplasmic adaptor subunit [Fusobacterium mortiferum]|jgi:RND family efflux transporter MFP subunit|uniref:efflux RND transporter periplasmic adaptor subunit n=1 Tax=Fusobacterium mortiferum TaxID=850 RepID=UPI000E55358D|nr:efflux RND transporter periplasmic adaptor subunit [Fusobacterium mortiferum]MCI7187273.1 efflux RND transporter periplasmic adaptor subunit [Fusobacterium mortiferum]MCI7666027.1 efflux RND transporter periplasmic adaptor subunit [Fusobacterium mortiferum]RHF67191.1 efflux RND transporter periplasmic adaptor subunit [Fusobacterium mortiferum]